MIDKDKFKQMLPVKFETVGDMDRDRIRASDGSKGNVTPIGRGAVTASGTITIKRCDSERESLNDSNQD